MRQPASAAIFFLLISFIFISCGAGKVNEEEVGKINFNANWKFKRIAEGEASSPNFFLKEFDDSNWEDVALPHTAKIEPLPVNDQWQGISWYRKTFKVPGGYKGKKIIIELEAAMNASEIWINGKKVTTHEGGFLPVVMDATPFLAEEGANIIAIRLDNTDNPNTGPKPLKILDFNTYGGLYRNAWLIVKNKVHISHPILADKVAGGGVFITYPEVSEEKSKLQIKTHVVNESKNAEEVTVEHGIYYGDKLVKIWKSDAFNLKSEENKEFVAHIDLEESKLWSPNNPNLYTLKTNVLKGEEKTDVQNTRLGIREFTFDKEHQLYINGKKTFLRGVNRHQEYPFVGYALSDNAQYRDVKKIKEAGFNYIRLSHYPQSPAVLEACDEFGLVVLDAILGWQYYNDTDEFRKNRYDAARNLIRRDRNHPSVLAWEVSLNETQMPIFFMEELDRITHSEYPGDKVYSAGWMNDVYDIFLQARQHRILHGYHEEEVKKKPYSVSEYGDWEYFSKNAGLNQDELPNELRLELSSRQLREYGEKRLLYQAKNAQESHNDNLGTPAFSDSYWVMYDYNRGYYDNLEASGLMDIFRIPKFAYYFYKSQQDPKEEMVLNIASWWTKDSPLDLKVFGNVEEVELYLNDKLIDRKTPHVDSISNNLKHPPFVFNLDKFEAGTLKAVGYIDGNKKVEHIVKTPQEPKELKVWLDKSGKAAEAGTKDLLFLYIAVVGKNGTIIPDYDKKIKLVLNGDIEIVNPNEIKAEAGIATALIRIGNTPGEVSVKARAEKLPETDFSFKVVQDSKVKL